MAVIRAKTFRGYSSKPDDLIDNLEFAQDCNDVCIHKGDICNLPLPKALFNRENSEVNVGFLETNIDNEYDWFRFDFGIDKILIINRNDRTGLNLDITDIENDLAQTGLNLKYFDGSQRASLLGKVFQLGDWLYLNANTYGFGFSSLGSVQSRMLRIKSWRERLPSGSFILHNNYGLVGIDAPVLAEVVSAASGSYTGAFDFAFTFVTNIKNINNAGFPAGLEYYDNSTKLGPDDIESNAASIGTFVSYTSKAVTYKLTLPPFLTSIRQTGPIDSEQLICGVYARVEEEPFYRFVGYWPLSNPQLDDNNVYTTYDVIINQSITQHTVRTPPLFTHSVPYNGSSVVFYRDRVYRNTSPFKYAILKEGSGIPEEVHVKWNLLQVSPTVQEEFDNSPFAASPSGATEAEVDSYKIANYRHVGMSVTVGSDSSPITGLIEFLGQLIIFKRRETYHLTNDMSVGSIRLLWPKIGCVNTIGGRGYVTAGNRLFFVAHDGVYLFTGEGVPVKISSAIEEDLLNVPFYDKAVLSVDFRYEHLYLTFIGQPIQFIFHYGESGGWTKSTNVREVLLDPDGGYYFNTPRKLQKLGFINSNIGTGLVVARTPSWSGGIITAGDSVRKKMWRELTIETQDVLSDDGGNITVDIKNAETLLTVITSLNSTLKQHHLGIYTSGLQIRLAPAGDFARTSPFRINGMSLTGELRGRR